MPQNSKYSHPRLGLCRVRDGIFSGQPLLPLKRGACLSPKTVLFDTKTCLADSNNLLLILSEALKRQFEEWKNNRVIS